MFGELLEPLRTNEGNRESNEKTLSCTYSYFLPRHIASSLLFTNQDFHLSLLLQDEDFTRGLVVGANEEPRASRVPVESSQTPAGAHGQRRRVAAAGALGTDDGLVAGLAVGRGDGRVRAVLVLLEGHLGDEVSLGRLPVPAAVERDVQVRGRLVEGVADGRRVRRERQARRHRLPRAGRVVEGRVGRHDELRARLQRRVVLEVGRLPHREAGRVAEPVVREGGLGVTN